jgi:hypothetical protein
MRNHVSRWSGASALVALIVPAAVCVGCVGAEDTSTVAEAVAVAPDPAPGDDATEVAPSFDDLATPAVDENDPASVEARALFELVGPDRPTAPSEAPAKVSTRPAGAGPRWSEEMPPG